MRIAANFEEWLLGDGSYPPFAEGMLVNLAFQMEPTSISKSQNDQENLVDHGDAQYSFTGRVLRVYRDGDAIAAVSSGPLKFFIETADTADLQEGEFVSGRGTLSVDYYAWTEGLPERADAPDLFFNLSVARIRKVAIPERFIHRSNGSVSRPARVLPADFGRVEVVQVMNDSDPGCYFYLVDFEHVDRPVPHTFIGAA